MTLAQILDEMVLGGDPRWMTWCQIAGGHLSSLVVMFGLSRKSIFRRKSFRWPVCAIAAGGEIYATGFIVANVEAIKIGVSIYGMGTSGLLISKLLREHR